MAISTPEFSRSSFEAFIDPNAPPAGRLPDGVRPTAYRLDLRIAPRRDGFVGTVEIDVCGRCWSTPGSR